MTFSIERVHNDLIKNSDRCFNKKELLVFRAFDSNYFFNFRNLLEFSLKIYSHLYLSPRNIGRDFTYENFRLNYLFPTFKFYFLSRISTSKGEF